MSAPPTTYTSPAELDGTVAGIVVTAIVATLALVLLIGMVYWAASHPDAWMPKAQRPGKAPRPGLAGPAPGAVPAPGKPAGAPPRASAQDQGYSFAVARAEPDDTTSGEYPPGTP